MQAVNNILESVVSNKLIKLFTFKSQTISQIILYEDKHGGMIGES